jgi:hypothetical protein
MARVIELVIRDPDFENTYVTETEGDVTVERFEIDLGSSFNGPKDFDREDPEMTDWACNHIAEVAHLPETSEVRQAVENLMRELLGPQVTVHIENDYEDGHHSELDIELPARDVIDEDWWQEIVWPHTGDGHAGNSCYTATITKADDPTLLNRTWEWC